MSGFGIAIASLTGFPPTMNMVQSNIVGLTVTGDGSLGNLVSGILIQNLISMPSKLLRKMR